MEEEQILDMKILLSLLVIGVLALGIVALHNPRVLDEVELVEEPLPVTILFVGDIMLDRGVRNAINREGVNYPFEAVRELLVSPDLSIGNLEGVFTDNPSIAVVNNKILRFTFDPSLVSMLKDFGFDGFSLANNHALDFGREGFENTRRLLSDNGMFSFGSPINDGVLSAKHSVREEKVCFVGYHSLFYPDTTLVLNEIKNLISECDFLVTVAHWGEEYQDEENEAQREVARSFIDAGADLVIGHHPHVVQPVEIYKDKAIFYSLGNFLFDQDFSIPTRQSLAVELSLGEDFQEFRLIPIEMSRARLYYPDSQSYAERKEILTSKLPQSLKVEISSRNSFRLPR